DGAPMIWQMNGTSIVSQTVLTNPGASWHAIGIGDFNGDGKADILWQSSDGTLGVWLMNGTTPTAMTALPNQSTTSSANAVQTSGSQPTVRLSMPDTAAAALTHSASADQSAFVPGTQNWLQQQLTTGAGRL
ncbi:MAG: VCBS repeat-containing protein, partial [Acidobacteriaceae bacterium]|nr:VCBS repeat-containing protein [Acidobacteriaceae bacterium]